MLENIFFMYREIVRGNDERDTHYYITRGRVKAKKEKARGFRINRQNTFSKRSNGWLFHRYRSDKYRVGTNQILTIKSECHSFLEFSIRRLTSSTHFFMPKSKPPFSNR